MKRWPAILILGLNSTLLLSLSSLYRFFVAIAPAWLAKEFIQAGMWLFAGLVIFASMFVLGYLIETFSP
jgi:hypothetical protein